MSHKANISSARNNSRNRALPNNSSFRLINYRIGDAQFEHGQARAPTFHTNFLLHLTLLLQISFGVQFNNLRIDLFFLLLLFLLL